jgi:hypothetical protein
MKKKPNDSIQLLTKIINVKHLLYTYANVMQQIDNLSCDLFPMTYVANITFGFNLKQYLYNVPLM